MNISEITMEQEISDYGKRYVEEKLIGLRVESEGNVVDLTYDTNNNLRHKEIGCLLEVDVMYDSFFVETASEDIGKYGYKQWHEFDSIEQLKIWIKENTEIPN